MDPGPVWGTSPARVAGSGNSAPGGRQEDAGARASASRSGQARAGCDNVPVSNGWQMLVAVVGGVLLLWIALLVVLLRSRPDELRLRDAIRLLPDLIRLFRRLAADTSLPRGVRVRLWALLAYLASPIDLVPDFIPIIGFADDAVIVALTLRSVSRRAGPKALERHWPGTADGFAAVRRLARLPADRGGWADGP